MAVYTYSAARQKLALVLNDADAGGAVQILRRDGRSYVIRAEKPSQRSPLDVPAIRTGATSADIVKAVREGRRRSARRGGRRAGK